jgi:hypothetical protein
MRLQVGLACAALGFTQAGVCALIACSDSAAIVAGDGGYEAMVADASPVEEADASSAEQAMDADALTPAEDSPFSAGDAAHDDAPHVGTAKCHPMSVTGFVPPPYVGPSVRSAACAAFDGDGGLAKAFGDSCLGASATYGPCAHLSLPDAAGAAACYSCLVSSPSPDASSYGVALEDRTAAVVNYFGCIQALDPTDAGISCAHAVQLLVYCVDYACKAACPPVSDDVSRGAYQSCTDEALRGGCLGYALSAQQCLSIEQGDGSTPVATVCFGGKTEEDHFLAAAHYFCGGS